MNEIVDTLQLYSLIQPASAVAAVNSTEPLQLLQVCSGYNYGTYSRKFVLLCMASASK